MEVVCSAFILSQEKDKENIDGEKLNSLKIQMNENIELNVTLTMNDKMFETHLLKMMRHYMTNTYKSRNSALSAAVPILASTVTKEGRRKANMI